MHDVITLAQALISRQSVTPNDAGCQPLLAERLSQLGFINESMVFADTTNLWARRGNKAPVFCFAGHTDVVPAGKESLWKTPPFKPVIIDNMLYGRGSADMKGSLAAMIVATERFVQEHPDHQGSIAFLLTSDEEGPFINGTTRVIDTLEARQEKIDYCIVGEPTSSKDIADTIKNGRRGSISGEIEIKGIQGHVAYPEQVKNPIHLAMLALHDLAQTHWDNGNEYFPPSSFQITNVQSGTGATNVVPSHLTAWFNLRFSTELDFNTIVKRIESLLDTYQIEYHIKWTYNGLPFITKPGKLVNAVQDAITQVTGKTAQLSTSGGTSDGRFIAPTGAEVIELGPCNNTIHQVNECVNCDHLIKLVDIYYYSLKAMLA
jgi:succinyl-diaminopimelate desuccinylase